MAYNHHEKAGNQGDCVKHPALIAALDAVLPPPEIDNAQNSQASDNAQKPSFHYLDVFAGHAWHPILDEREVPGVQKAREWKKGIEALHKELWNGRKLNRHVQLWRDWYLPDRPSLVRGWYPGSSVIAADVCRKHKRPIRMTLFDISDEVHDDLRRWFQPVYPNDLTKNDWCVIGRSLDPTQVKEDAIREPEFVFIDPPKFGDGADLPDWRPHFQHILHPRAESPTFMWLPASGADNDWERLGECRQVPNVITNGRNPGFFRQLNECRYVGYHWTAARWARGGSNAACILVYNCAEDKIRAAVNCIVNIAGWGNGQNGFRAVKHSDGASASE